MAKVFVKPLFKGAIGKKGKVGLIGRATDLRRRWPRRSACTSQCTGTATSAPRPCSESVRMNDAAANARFAASVSL